jgi:uncharacterized protein YbjT (DUF2867 family)
MKYTITGSTGHISKPLAQKLVSAGHEVSIITTKKDRVAEIEALGATAVIGSVEDVGFLTAAFKGADGVYTMVPPNFSPANWKNYIGKIGHNFAAAIRNAGVRHVVNLSSVGAHLSEGCGPVSGLFEAEKALNGLDGVNVVHLRPGFFYYNFFANVGMIQHMGIIGGNYGTDTKLYMADTNDIASEAARALSDLAFTGKSHQYIMSDAKTTGEIATILGKGIGKPDLQWVDFTDDQNIAGMIQAGLPEEIAKNYTEMGAAMRTGKMVEDFVKSPVFVGRTKLESFASEFAGAFKAQHV